MTEEQKPDGASKEDGTNNTTASGSNLSNPVVADPHQAAVELWDSLKGDLRQPSSLGEDVCSRWLDPLSARTYKEIKGDTGTTRKLVLHAPLTFYEDWFNQHHRKKVTEAASSKLGSVVEIEVVVSKDSVPALATHTGKKSPDIVIKDKPKIFAKDIVVLSDPDPHMTLDNFIPGPNPYAHKSAVGVAQKFDRAKNPVYIWGPPGTGKTHLIHGMANEFLRINPSAKVKCAPLEVLMNSIIHSFKVKNSDKVRDEYRRLDFLGLDDVHFLEGNKAFLNGEMFNALNQMLEYCQVALTCNKAAGELAGLPPALISRFGGGLVLELIGVDDETKLRILEQHLKRYVGDIEPYRFALKYLADNTCSDMRLVLGGLTNVRNYTDLMGHCPSTASQMHPLIRDAVIKQDGQITSQQILQAVAKEYGIQVEDITRKGRPGEIIEPRQAAMLLVKKHSGLNSTQMEKIFGKTYDTIRYGAREMAKDIANDLEKFRRVSRIAGSYGMQL